MSPLRNMSDISVTACDFTVTGENKSFFLEPDRLVEAAGILYERKYFIEDVTCLETTEGVMVLYHFDMFEEPGRVTLRVIVTHERPILPSIASIYQGAEWHERECMDFFPVVFENNPNPAPLLLADDMETRPLSREDKTSLRTVFRFAALEECPGRGAIAEVLRAMADEHAQAAGDQSEGEG